MANRLAAHFFRTIALAVFIGGGVWLLASSLTSAQLIPTVSLPPLPSVSLPPVVPGGSNPTPTPNPTSGPTPTATVATNPTPTSQSQNSGGTTTSNPSASGTTTKSAPSGSTRTGAAAPITNPIKAESTTQMTTPTSTPSSTPARLLPALSINFSDTDWYVWITLLIALLLILLAIGLYFFRRYQASVKVQESVPKVVHELRTPLSALKGYLSMILRGNYGSLSATQKGPLISAMSTTQRLSSMVNDLLDESSLEAGKIKLRVSDFALDGLVQEVLASLQPLAKEKNLALTAENSGGAIVLADRDRVRQILTNLIGNSVKFTEKGSINVASTVDDQLVKVLVTNTGPAMTIEQQQQLFKKFEQLGNKARGTGLGLYVSRELAQAMGGDLWLEKSVPEGTTFAFSLPLANLVPLKES